MRLHRIALSAIFLSALAIGLGYASAFLPGDTPAWGPWLFALGTATILVAAMALGASKAARGSHTAVNAAIAFTWIVLAGGFGFALLAHDPDPAHPLLWLGLPRAAAVILYGIGLIPVVILPLAYALTFDRATLTPEDWQRVRAAARDAHEEMRT
jgi:hypothetical protein